MTAGFARDAEVEGEGEGCNGLRFTQSTMGQRGPKYGIRWRPGEWPMNLRVGKASVFWGALVGVVLLTGLAFLLAYRAVFCCWMMAYPLSDNAQYERLFYIFSVLCISVLGGASVLVVVVWNAWKAIVAEADARRRAQ